MSVWFGLHKLLVVHLPFEQYVTLEMVSTILQIEVFCDDFQVVIKMFLKGLNVVVHLLQAAWYTIQVGSSFTVIVDLILFTLQLQIKKILSFSNNDRKTLQK